MRILLAVLTEASCQSLKTSFSDFTTLFFSFTAAAVVVDVTMNLLVLTVTL